MLPEEPATAAANVMGQTQQMVHHGLAQRQVLLVSGAASTAVRPSNAVARDQRQRLRRR